MRVPAWPLNGESLWLRSTLMLALILMEPHGMAWSAPPTSTSHDAQETIKGEACYHYGDNETINQAKTASRALAQENAVKQYRVFVASSTTVKNFQLEEDVIHTASAELLEQVEITKQDVRDREVCTAVSAIIRSTPAQHLVEQRLKAKETNQKVIALISPTDPAWGKWGRVWTNNANGRYVEGDRVVISVQSDHNAYLKLDYFQADGTVVHMVPNPYNIGTFLKAGQVYTFGDATSPELFTIRGPVFGSETLQAIFSTHPFDADTGTPQQSAQRIDKSDQYIKAGAGTRGVRGMEVTSNLQSNTPQPIAAQSISLYTESKTLQHYRGIRGLP